MAATGINANSVDPIGIVDGLAPEDRGTFEVSDEDRALVNQVEEIFSIATSAEWFRLLHENMYLAMLYGDQYLAVDANTNQIIQVLGDNQQSYAAQNNKLIIAALKLWGKLTKDQPDFQISPIGKSFEASQGAEAAETIIKYYRDNKGFQEVIDTAQFDSMWSFKGGCCELLWDPEGGSDFWWCETCGYKYDGELDCEECPCPYCIEQHEQIRQQTTLAHAAYEQAQQQYVQQTAMGAVLEPPPAPPDIPEPPIGTLQKINRGGPCLKYIDARSIRFISGPTNRNLIQGYIVREQIPVNVLRAEFPLFAHLIQPEPDVLPNNGAQWTVFESTGIRYSQLLNDHAYRYKIVERPTGLYPRGRISFMINQMIVDQREGYFDVFGRLPLFRMGWIPEKGTPYFRPPIADAVFRQRSLNRLETNAEEHTSLTAHPKTILPERCRISDSELTSQSAQILRPTVGTANMVRYLLPPPLSQDVYRRRAMAIEDINALFTVDAVSSDASGRAVALETDLSTQTTAPVLRQHMREESEIYRCSLILHQMFGDEEETINVLADGKHLQVQLQDMSFSARRATVSIVADDGLSTNPTERRNYALAMLQEGIFSAGGAPDIAAYAQAAGIKMPALIPSGPVAAAETAMESILLQTRGEQWEPAPYDDMKVFVDVYTEWLTVNGREFKKKNPKALQAILQTYGYYQMNYAQQQIQQQMMGAQVQDAAVGGSSGGSPMKAGQEQTDGGGASKSSAASLMKQADAVGEKSARSGLSHEGAIQTQT